jgi:hypothetical protein
MAWCEDKMEEGRQLERRLQDEGLVDPSTVVPVKPLEVNTFVDGVVRESADQISWHVEVSGADGTVITRDEGSVPVAERLSVTTKIAERLMSRLCPNKARHLSARYNDLALEDVICDLSKPFRPAQTGEKRCRPSRQSAGETVACRKDRATSSLGIADRARLSLIVAATR